MTADEWEASGRHVRVGSMDLFVVEGAPAGAAEPPVVVLHGYPTSSYDYCSALPQLAAERRAVVHDHPGFGLSDKPADYSYSLVEQAEQALELWQELGIPEAHLVAHDYGTSVATEILARREGGWEPVRLRSLTLCNGSVYVEMAGLRRIQRLLLNPWLGPLVARLASFETFKREIRGILGERDRVTEEELQVHWQLLERGGGRSLIPRISRYLEERRRFRRRWTDPLGRLDIPTLILWGMRDPVAVPDIGRRLAEEIPGAVWVELEELGHFPMLEDPEWWAREVRDFIRGVA